MCHSPVGNGWAKAGVFENLFKAMSDDPDLEYALIPSHGLQANHCRAANGTIVSVHQKASGAKGGLRLRPSIAGRAFKECPRGGARAAG